MQEKKLKQMSLLFYIIAFIGFALFILMHYQYISTGPFSFDPKGYFILIPIFALAMLATTILDIRIQKIKGEKIKWGSILFEVIIYAALTAYAIYLYTMPVGYCPIYNFFNRSEFNQINFGH